MLRTEQGSHLPAEADRRLGSRNLERSGKLGGFFQFLRGQLRQDANGLLDLLEPFLHLWRRRRCVLLEFGDASLAFRDRLAGLVEPLRQFLDQTSLRVEDLPLLENQA